MRHDHLKRELELIVLLTQNRMHSAEEICDMTGISRRSFYYYIEFFEQAGFKVEKRRGKYSLDRSSAFFTKLFDILQFTEDEALLIRQLIDEAGDKSSRLRDLHAKLDRFYDFRILSDEQLAHKTAHIRSTLYEAVKEQQVVEIIDYSSPNSHTVSNRRVEPFLFLNNNNDIRCYEPATGKNKTFRLSRMGDVVKLNEGWHNPDAHKQVFTDLFAFSGEKTMKVSMYMGQLSHNVMLEEYPASAVGFVRQDNNRWYFETDVCSYLGIGRFVLGMYDDIEVTGDQGFKAYLTEKINLWHKKCVYDTI